MLLSSAIYCPKTGKNSNFHQINLSKLKNLIMVSYFLTLVNSVISVRYRYWIMIILWTIPSVLADFYKSIVIDYLNFLFFSMKYRTTKHMKMLPPLNINQSLWKFIEGLSRVKGTFVCNCIKIGQLFLFKGATDAP